jgi:glycosyltransferase involved in cell wall biosynthesis
MNVLVVSDVDPAGRASGAERILVAHCAGLAARDHTVCLIAGTRGGSGSPVELTGTVRLYRYAWSPSAFARVARLCRSLFSEVRFDVAVLHQPFSGLGVLLAPGSRSIPKAYVFHSPWAQEYAVRGTGRGALAGAGRFLRRWVERRALRASRRIFVLSRFMAGRLEAEHPGLSARAVVLPGGVALDRFAPADDREALKRSLSIRPGGVLLVAIRDLEPRMGLDNLLRAFREVSREREDATLLIGGDGPMRSELAGLAAGLGLGDSVRFEGYIPEARLPLYYQAADFCVLPTRALEGFGLVTAEALACGTPVLGTPVGATPELLAALQPDLLFEGVEPPALARGILAHLRRARHDPGGYRILRARCREYAAARFGWDRIAERLEGELLAVARI